MSKYVKYVSSEHYGAPVMKGDRFGYLVEMLRTVLCTGFNEHTDVRTIEVLTEKRFKVTFETEHNYSVNQTIKISNSPSPELTDEHVVYKVEDKFNIILETYNDLGGIIGSKFENLFSVSSIVAPLGFVEKFQDGYRSVFTTDEDEAYLYIDDSTPSHWDGALSTNRTPLICPIVYMTDKKPDIETDGKYIVPFDTNNPTWYKLHSFLNGTNKRNGMWNWLSYGLSGSASNGNLLAERSIPLKYDIIGNGRMFYFIPQIQWTPSSFYPQIYYFGKINSDHDNNDNLPYILNSSLYLSNDNVYAYIKLNTTYYMFAPTNYQSQSYTSTIDIGNYTQAVLKIDNKSSPIFIKPTIHNLNVISISGSTTNHKMEYPDKYSKKLFVTRLKVNDNNGYIGDLSGLLHVSNIQPYYFPHGGIKNFGNKKMFVINGTYNAHLTASSSTTSQYIYFLSLDYKDWFNYE